MLFYLSRSVRADSISLTQLGDRMSEVRRKRPVHVWFQGRQVQFDDLVVFSVSVGCQQAFPVLIRGVGNLASSGGSQIILHAEIVGEYRGGGANFCAHVANGGHSSAADAVDAGAEVLDDRPGSSLHRQDTSDLQDYVLGAGPALQRSSQLHADDFGTFQLPRYVGHHVHGVGATHADAKAAEAAAVGRVRVGTDHQQAWESVVLEDDLMDDAGARVPETDAVLGPGCLQEVVHLLVDVFRALQVLLAAHLRLDQVVAVNRGRHGDFWQSYQGKMATLERQISTSEIEMTGKLISLRRARRLHVVSSNTRADKLQHGHLSGRVLHSDAIWSQPEVAGSTDNFLLVGFIEVRVQNFLGECQWPVQSATISHVQSWMCPG